MILEQYADDTLVMHDVWRLNLFMEMPFAMPPDLVDIRDFTNTMDLEQYI